VYCRLQGTIEPVDDDTATLWDVDKANTWMPSYVRVLERTTAVSVDSLLLRSHVCTDNSAFYLAAGLVGRPMLFPSIVGNQSARMSQMVGMRASPLRSSRRSNLIGTAVTCLHGKQPETKTFQGYIKGYKPARHHRCSLQATSSVA